MIDQADQNASETSRLIAWYGAIAAAGIGCGIVAYLTHDQATRSSHVLIVMALALFAYGLTGLFSYIVTLKYYIYVLMGEEDPPEQRPIIVNAHQHVREKLESEREQQ